MTETTTKRAARSLGGIVREPPITRDMASTYLGAEVSKEAWLTICQAFASYGDRCDDLAASRLGKSKDPQKASWHERQKSTITALEAVLDRLESVRNHGEFLREASENYSLISFNASFGPEVNADQILREAYRKILDALVIIERAEPMEIDVPTDANARARLAREIKGALAQDGIALNLSDRRALPEDAAEADLTPFEQLLSALGVHDGETPSAVARWIHRAVTHPK